MCGMNIEMMKWLRAVAARLMALSGCKNTKLFDYERSYAMFF